MHFGEVTNLCLQMAPLSVFVHKKRVESFLAQRKVCNQTFGTNSNNLAQGDSRDICWQKAYVYSGLGRTPKTSKLGSGGIQQFAFQVVGFVHHNQIENGRLWQGDKIQCNPHARHHPSTLVFGRPEFPTTEI